MSKTMNVPCDSRTMTAAEMETTRVLAARLRDVCSEHTVESTRMACIALLARVMDVEVGGGEFGPYAANLARLLVHVAEANKRDDAAVELGGGVKLRASVN